MIFVDFLGKWWSATAMFNAADVTRILIHAVRGKREIPVNQSQQTRRKNEIFANR